MKKKRFCYRCSANDAILSENSFWLSFCVRWRSCTGWSALAHKMANLLRNTWPSSISKWNLNSPPHSVSNILRNEDPNHIIETVFTVNLYLMLATMHKNANIMVVNVYYTVATLDTHIEYLYEKKNEANQRLDENRSANQMLSCFLLVRPQWPLRKYNEHAQPIFFMRFSFLIAQEHSCNQYNTLSKNGMGVSVRNGNC